MLSAEFSAGFILLLLLADLVGMRPRDLLGAPPLDLFAGGGATGHFIGELIAYVLAFAAYQVVVLGILRGIRGLGDLGSDTLQRALADGRDSAGLRPVLWLTLLGAPSFAIAATATRQVIDPVRLVFVAALLGLTAAQSLRHVEWSDFWASARAIGSWFRAATRPPSAIPAMPAPPERRPTPPTRHDDRSSTDAASGWLEAR